MRLSAALLSALCLGAALCPLALAQLPTSDPQRLVDNLKFIKQEVLPDPNMKVWMVMKWHAYGHGIRNLATAAAQGADGIALYYNSEAAEVIDAATAAGTAVPPMLRILPASFNQAVDAVQVGMSIQELMGPGNQENLTMAAEAAGKTIPVHIYLYNHYNDPWGYNFTTAAELQELIDSLPANIDVKGVMMHLNGLEDSEKDGFLKKFFGVVCPVAATLQTKGRRLAVHWADSGEIRRETPKDQKRMAMPADACKDAANIDYWVRPGWLGYGTDLDTNAALAAGTKPVMTWAAPVTAVEDVGGKKVATITVASPGRFPAPNWWAFADGYKPEFVEDGQPDVYVSINNKEFRLASNPQGSNPQTIKVDVTEAETPVQVGDSACLICEQRPLNSLSDDLGVFDYDTGLCLNGWGPVNTDFCDCVPTKTECTDCPQEF